MATRYFGLAGRWWPAVDGLSAQAGILGNLCDAQGFLTQQGAHRVKVVNSKNFTLEP